MSLKKYINRINMSRNPSEIQISVHKILKANIHADLTDIVCKQEILLSQTVFDYERSEDLTDIECKQEIIMGNTVFDYVRRCVRGVIVVEYFTRKRYFTSRVFLSVRTIYEVDFDCCHPKFEQWLLDGKIVQCTTDNIKEVFKAKIKELNKNAMRNLSRVIR